MRYPDITRNQAHHRGCQRQAIVEGIGGQSSDVSPADQTLSYSQPVILEHDGAASDGAQTAGGQSITIMVVGDSGVGKSSLLSNLFHQELDDSPERGPTLRVTERVLKFDLGGVPFSALLIDSPGYHDSLNLGRSIKLVTDHIDSMFATTLANERRPHRKPESERETHLGVDVVLYFFSNPNPNPNPNQGLVTVTLALTRCS